MAQFQAALRKQPPDCIVTEDPTTPNARFAIGLYNSFEKEPITPGSKVVVICRK